MIFLYLIIAAILLSTYRRPIATFSIWLLPYFACHFTIMYCTCIPVVLINAVEDAGMESRGECHGNAGNLFAPVVLLGPSGPWLR